MRRRNGGGAAAGARARAEGQDLRRRIAGCRRTIPVGRLVRGAVRGSREDAGGRLNVPMKAAAPLEELTGEFLGSYMGDERARRISHRYLPSREAIVEILESVLDLMYPGYFGRRDLNRDNLGEHVAQAVAVLAPRIEREMEHCLCYGRERESGRSEPGECAPRAQQLAQI